jgi:hypothetical protein
MDIREFWELSAGEWMAQRTSHHIAFRRFEGGQLTVTVATLTADAPEIIKTCQHHNVDPSTVLCGSKEQWVGSLDANRGQVKGQVLLVLVPDADNSNIGRVLWHRTAEERTGNGDEVPEPEEAMGTYNLGADEALTLVTEYDSTVSEERIWFASPNLRLRSCLLKRFGGFSTATLSSEIRKLSANSAQAVKAAMQQ